MSWFSFNGHIYLEDEMSKDLTRRSLREIAVDIRRNFTQQWRGPVARAIKAELKGML